MRKNLKKDIKRRLISLMSKDLSIREIARTLNLPKSTVHRYIQQLQNGNTSPRKAYLNLKKHPEVVAKIKKLLKFHTEEKGESRVLYVTQLYRILAKELKPFTGELSEKQFKKFLEFFIRKEFKTQYRLEKERRLKKELPRFKTPDGSLVREKAYWEIDITGYTFKGKQYSIMQAVDRLTGFAFPALVIANMEKGASYYNKAFNQLEVMNYIKKLIEGFGKPARIITDNEAILQAENVILALTELGIEVKRTIPGNPNQKLIERIFRDIKQNAREILASEGAETINELWAKATYLYNTRPHKTKHLGQVIPLEVVKEIGVSVGEVSQEELEFAFTERFERIWRANLIQIDGKIYELVLPRSESLRVICRRPLNNIHVLYVFNAETQEYIGTASLVTKPLAGTTIEDRQKTQLVKRIEKKLTKIEVEKDELVRVKLTIRPEEEDAVQTLEILAPKEVIKEKKQEIELELDFIKLFAGGEENEDTCIPDSQKMH